MIPTSTNNICNDCDAALCPTCSLCVECVPGHIDGYDGELYGLIGMLGVLMETHECNPSPHHAAITALLQQADSALRSVEHIMGH
jgi:hypothetical protein